MDLITTRDAIYISIIVASLLILAIIKLHHSINDEIKRNSISNQRDSSVGECSEAISAEKKQIFNPRPGDDWTEDQLIVALFLLNNDPQYFLGLGMWEVASIMNRSLSALKTQIYSIKTDPSQAAMKAIMKGKNTPSLMTPLESLFILLAMNNNQEREERIQAKIDEISQP